jgi:hypothetical protein
MVGLHLSGQIALEVLTLPCIIQSIPGDGFDDVHPVIGTWAYVAAIELDEKRGSRLKEALANAGAVRVRM